MFKTVLVCLSLSYLAVEIFGLSCDDICEFDDRLEIYGPVCGSDGKTYDTKCDLKKAVCKSRKAVSIVHYGKCMYSGEACIKKIFCYFEKALLCGSDGTLYHNECAMRKHACQRRTAIVGVKLGPHCSSCPTCNGGSKKKVCGSDHKTYNSLCKLRAEACKKRKAIIVLKNGACEGQSDPPKPVWGFKRDQAKATTPEPVWGFKRDQAKTTKPGPFWGFKRDQAKPTTPEPVWGFKRDQAKATTPEPVWGFKRDQANSDEPEDVWDAMEDEDTRLPDEEEDEDDDDAYEDDDQD